MPEDEGRKQPRQQTRPPFAMQCETNIDSGACSGILFHDLMILDFARHVVRISDLGQTEALGLVELHHGNVHSSIVWSFGVSRPDGPAAEHMIRGVQQAGSAAIPPQWQSLSRYGARQLGGSVLGGAKG